MQCKVGTRLITVTGVQDSQDPAIVSSIFQEGNVVEQISAQQMKKLAKTKTIFLAVIRTIENEQ